MLNHLQFWLSKTKKYHYKLLLSLRLHTKGRPVEIQAYTIPNFTGVIPSHHKLRESLRKLPPSLDIAQDVSKDCAADIIIGNDYYHSIIKGERIEVTSTLLLIDSAIGWILSGTYTDNQLQHRTLSVLTYYQGGAVTPWKYH